MGRYDDLGLAYDLTFKVGIAGFLIGGFIATGNAIMNKEDYIFSNLDYPAIFLMGGCIGGFAGIFLGGLAGGAVGLARKVSELINE